jgi:hypothetical protein
VVAKAEVVAVVAVPDIVADTVVGVDTVVSDISDVVVNVAVVIVLAVPDIIVAATVVGVVAVVSDIPDVVVTVAVVTAVELFSRLNACSAASWPWLPGKLVIWFSVSRAGQGCPAGR